MAIEPTDPELVHRLPVERADARSPRNELDAAEVRQPEQSRPVLAEHEIPFVGLLACRHLGGLHPRRPVLLMRCQNSLPWWPSTENPTPLAHATDRTLADKTMSAYCLQNAAGLDLRDASPSPIINAQESQICPSLSGALVAMPSSMRPKRLRAGRPNVQAAAGQSWCHSHHHQPRRYAGRRRVGCRHRLVK